MELGQTSQDSGSSTDLGSSADLGSAVQSVQDTAPKLTGLDKLRAQKEFVEKNDAVPPKAGEAAPVRGPDGKFQKPGTPAAPAAKTAVVPAAGATPPPADGTPAPYTPDYKYKAGGKEMEIPEKFRALITDKESEEEVKKLFGQAATLDEFKANNSTLKENLGKVGQALNQYQGGIQQLRQLVAKNDFDGFFQKINIPQEKIFQWVLDKVNYNQLPPEQRAQIDQQRELQRQRDEAQSNVQHVSQRELQLATQVKEMQLDQSLGKADHRAMAEAFDSRVGKPGAFKAAIIDHAKTVWALSQVDLTPDQAVASFVERYGNPALFGTPAPAAGAASPAPNTPAPSANAAPAASANSTPPVKVIPNVAGRSASPLKSKPKSLDDLKRLRDQAIKEENASRNPSQGYLAG